MSEKNIYIFMVSYNFYLQIFYILSGKNSKEMIINKSREQNMTDGKHEMTGYEGLVIP